MKRTDETFDLSATDLVAYLNCRHLSGLDLAAAEAIWPSPRSGIPIWRFSGNEVPSMRRTMLSN